MAVSKQDDGADGGQAKGARHTPYPYYSLAKALELAEIVRDLGGVNRPVQKSLIAHRMGVEEDSPTLMGVLGAAKLYNLIEGRGSFQLTDVAKNYFHPTSANQRQLAHLQMVVGPPLFAALIERFDGARIPDQEMLVNILHRDHHIAESWRSRAASLFLSSLREAQLIDGAGFIRYRASLDANSAGNIGVMKEPATNTPEASTVSVGAPPAPKSSVLPAGIKKDDTGLIWGLDTWTAKVGDDILRLETSHDLSPAAWERLNRYVQAIKPEKVKTDPAATGS
jgi:hypothetical protein